MPGNARRVALDVLEPANARDGGKYSPRSISIATTPLNTLGVAIRKTYAGPIHTNVTATIQPTIDSCEIHSSVNEINSSEGTIRGKYREFTSSSGKRIQNTAGHPGTHVS